MNLQFLERIPTEKIVDVIRSVMVFMVILVVISAMGLIFSASH